MKGTQKTCVGPGPPGRMTCSSRRPDTAPPGGAPEGESGRPLHVQEGESCLPLHLHRSSAWLRPSATRLTATTRLAIASAGNSVGHQRPPTRYEYCSKIERPQSGAGGWIPKPMKESVAVAKIAYPRRTVNSTRTGPRTLGRISTNIT